MIPIPRMLDFARVALVVYDIEIYKHAVLRLRYTEGPADTERIKHPNTACNVNAIEPTPCSTPEIDVVYQDCNTLWS